MKEFFSRGDIALAVVVIIGCFVLIGLGIDGEVKGILGLGSGYIFGRGASAIAQIKNH